VVDELLKAAPNAVIPFLAFVLAALFAFLKFMIEALLKHGEKSNEAIDNNTKALYDLRTSLALIGEGMRMLLGGKPPLPPAVAV
jgi:hypothetical protein